MKPWGPGLTGSNPNTRQVKDLGQMLGAFGQVDLLWLDEISWSEMPREKKNKMRNGHVKEHSSFGSTIHECGFYDLLVFSCFA